jgi:hypothetical protein
MHRDRRLSLLRASFGLALPLAVLACDLMNKGDSAGGAPSASASNAATQPGAPAAAPGSTQAPLAVAPSAATANRGGTAPVRLPDGGLESPDGAAWSMPSSLVVPSNLPPMPSHLPAIPSGLPPIPSNLPFPRPPSTH